MAHEINNPLAGILAAISCLQLEDEINLNYKSELEDMTLAAKRCKELIDIFLGFSRARPQKNTGNFETSMIHALDLLRSRMIESKIMINFSYKLVDGGEKKHINASIFSMTFYLILSDVMLSVCKQSLITEKKITKSITLDLECIEYKDNFQMKINCGYPNFELLEKSKLVSYLLKIENYKMSVELNKIIFSSFVEKPKDRG